MAEGLRIYPTPTSLAAANLVAIQAVQAALTTVSGSTVINTGPLVQGAAYAAPAYSAPDRSVAPVSLTTQGWLRVLSMGSIDGWNPWHGSAWRGYPSSPWGR